MKTPSRKISKSRHIVCPAFGSDELRPRGLEQASCDSCGLSVEIAIFRTLERIATLPDAVGTHACECGHPKMRELPGRVFHCPACRSEVLPIEAQAVDTRRRGRKRSSVSRRTENCMHAANGVALRNRTPKYRTTGSLPEHE